MVMYVRWVCATEVGKSVLAAHGTPKFAPAPGATHEVVVSTHTLTAAVQYRESREP